MANKKIRKILRECYDFGEEDEAIRLLEALLQEREREAVIGYLDYVVDQCEENTIYIPDEFQSDGKSPNGYLESYFEEKEKHDT